MSDIFISYASEDRDRVKSLARALEREGWSVWWDQRIPTGRSFDEVIQEALDASKAVVVVWTKTSVKSSWVKNEARRGLRRRVLFPVMLLEELKIPLEFEHVQAAQLMDWQPEEVHSGFDQFVQDIAQVLGPPPGPGFQQLPVKQPREEPPYQTKSESGIESPSDRAGQVKQDGGLQEQEPPTLEAISVALDPPRESLSSLAEAQSQALLSGIASGRAKPTTVPFPAHTPRATPPATVESKYPVSEPINRDPFANWSVFEATATGDGGFAYLYRSESTRVTQINEFRLSADQRRIIDALLHTAILHVPSGGFRAFAEILIPNHLKELLAQASRLCLVVDEHTAHYPWELIFDPSQNLDAPSLAVRSELIRRLVRHTNYEERARDTTSCSAYVVGDPLTPSDYPELRAARKEAELVASLLKAHYTVNHSSQRLGALEVLNQLFAQPYRIIHIAGHCYYSEGGINTAGAKAGVVLDNGLFLTSAEIARPNLIPELVFLNCGYIGQIGRTAYNKMAASISRELIMKGVRAVVAAGWPVHDDAARCFAEAFYTDLLAGQPFGLALKKARRKTWDAFVLSSTTTDPFSGSFSTAWGAYQAYGDPDFSLIELAAKDRHQIGNEPPAPKTNRNKTKQHGGHPMDPLTLESVSTVLTIVDKVANQIDRFIHKKPDPAVEKPHGVLAKKEGDAIVVRRKGQVIQKITAADIAKLDDNSQKLIKAMEDSMQKNFDLWTAVYPQRDTSPDPVRNAQVDAQLKDIAKKMCSDLSKIFKYLKTIGTELEDHYSSIRFVCDELGHN